MIMNLIAVILTLSAPTMLLVKNEITYRSRALLIEAIDLYNQQSDDYISYDVLPSYDSIFYDLHIWSYKKILPKEIMDKLEPYIQEAKKCLKIKLSVF